MSKLKPKKVTVWSPKPIRDFQANVCSSAVCRNDQRRHCEKAGHCLERLSQMDKAGILGVALLPDVFIDEKINPERIEMERKVAVYMKARYKKCREVKITFEGDRK